MNEPVETLREQIKKLGIFIDHRIAIEQEFGYTPEVENEIDEVVALIHQHTTAARIDELVKLRPSFHETGYAGTHVVYQTSFNIDERIKSLQAEQDGTEPPKTVHFEWQEIERNEP